MFCFSSSRCALDDQTHFRSGRDQNDLGPAVRRLGQDVGPTFQPSAEA